jgi:hypothetical protein
MTGCLHMWKNIFGRNSVNQKTIPTLMSLSLYNVWARMNIELQLIMYHIDRKSMWTALVITLRGHTGKHSGISIVLLSCILYYNKIICRTSEMAHICMYACACVCVSMYVRTYLCVYVRAYVSMVITLKVFLILSHHSRQQKAGGDGC